jgi:hypothetical protein
VRNENTGRSVQKTKSAFAWWSSHENKGMVNELRVVYGDVRASPVGYLYAFRERRVNWGTVCADRVPADNARVIQFWKALISTLAGAGCGNDMSKHVEFINIWVQVLLFEGDHLTLALWFSEPIGGKGKGLFVKILTALLGKDCTVNCNNIEAFIKDQFTEFRLKARLITFDETPRKIDSFGTILSIITDPTSTWNAKFLDQRQGEYQSGIIFSTNKDPIGLTNIWRRIMLTYPMPESAMEQSYEAELAWGYDNLISLTHITAPMKMLVAYLASEYRRNVAAHPDLRGYLRRQLESGSLKTDVSMRVNVAGLSPLGKWIHSCLNGDAVFIKAAEGNLAEDMFTDDQYALFQDKNTYDCRLVQHTYALTNKYAANMAPAQFRGDFVTAFHAVASMMGSPGRASQYKPQVIVQPWVKLVKRDLVSESMGHNHRWVNVEVNNRNPSTNQKMAFKLNTAF